jgi:hypothetical protein
VRSWFNGETPTKVKAPKSNLKSSASLHVYMPAHQHNLYTPPAAVISVLPQEMTAPDEEIVVGLPAAVIRGSADFTPHVSSTK